MEARTKEKEAMAKEKEAMAKENVAMKLEREEMLKQWCEAQTAKPVTVDRHQPGCQPQKLPPLPQFDGKDPKIFGNFERWACAMVEANKLIKDEGRKFAFRMCLTDLAADQVNELVESPKYEMMSYAEVKIKFFDLLSDSSDTMTDLEAFRSVNLTGS